MHCLSICTLFINLMAAMSKYCYAGAAARIKGDTRGDSNAYTKVKPPRTALILCMYPQEEQ